MTSIKSSVDEFVDDRPFCEDCRGYTCGGLGVYEPECCCDSDEESDEEDDACKDMCCECGKFKDTGNVCDCGGGHREICDECKENKPSIFERLALPPTEEFELLSPDEQELQLLKFSAELATATDAEWATALEAVAAVKAKKPIKLKLKKKKPIKLKLKLKKEC